MMPYRWFHFFLKTYALLINKVDSQKADGQRENFASVIYVRVCHRQYYNATLIKALDLIDRKVKKKNLLTKVNFYQW